MLKQRLLAYAQQFYRFIEVITQPMVELLFYLLQFGLALIRETAFKVFAYHLLTIAYEMVDYKILKI